MLIFSAASSSSPRCTIRNFLTCFFSLARNGIYFRQTDTLLKVYILRNGFILDGRKERSLPRVFVTVPRMRMGIPITLSTVSDVPGQSGPLLRAYPNWEMNQDRTCAGIISVYRVAVSNSIFQNYLKFKFSFRIYIDRQV